MELIAMVHACERKVLGYVVEDGEIAIMYVALIQM